MPFSPGLPSLDSYMVVPLLAYSLQLQILPVSFEGYLAEPDGSAAVQVTSSGEEGWQWFSPAWSPDSTRLLYTEIAKAGGSIAQLLEPIRTRIQLMTFDAPDELREPWPAIGLLRQFDPEAADRPDIDIGTLVANEFPVADRNVRFAGAVSGSIVIEGHFDLANGAYDTTVTADNFSDSDAVLPQTGFGMARVASSENIFDTMTEYAMSVTRADGDWFQTHVWTEGVALDAKFEWSVGSSSGDEEVHVHAPDQHPASTLP